MRDFYHSYKRDIRIMIIQNYVKGCTKDGHSDIMNLHLPSNNTIIPVNVFNFCISSQSNVSK